MEKQFDLSFVGITTGDDNVDRLINADETRLAVMQFRFIKKDFDDALELARKILEIAKAKGMENARIFGVMEVDPDEDDE